MAIWKITPALSELNRLSQNTIHHSLGIEFTEIGDDYLEATMPVDARTHQPMGLLHGGASAVLAESLASIAALLVEGPDQASCFGLELNASHVNSIRTGFVVGRATPIRLGKSVHVWQIEIRNQTDPSHPLVCHAKLTVIIKKNK